MTRSLSLLGLFLGAAMARSAEAKIDVKPLVEGNAAFAFDLYGKLKDQKGNLFLSPFSISAALGMTSTGARGNTLAQMTQTLHLPPAVASAGFGKLIGTLNAADPKAYQLSVANSLFGQKGYPWLPEFLAETGNYYKAGLREVDFGRADAARKEINDWVEGKTANRIKDLMQPGSVDSMTRLVLVNAIYFKGNWSRPFDPKMTANAAFHTAANTTVKSNLMQTTGRLLYTATPDMQVVALPYNRDQLSMVILLPTKVDGLPALEAGLSGPAVAKWISQMGATDDTTVYLPKFKMESTFALGDQLAAMGMGDAFDAQKADFSGMDGRRDLSIGLVVHKSFVEVNEEGTEAAAATAVGIRAMSMPTKAPPTVRCDHPFLFLIRDNASGSILFLGRLNEPK